MEPHGSQTTQTHGLAQTYERIRVAVLDGTLVAGQAYSQAELTKLLGVSRTPLREAIRRLESEGFFEHQQNRRVRVAPLQDEDLNDLYAMRIVLESLAVRIGVGRLTENDLDAIRAAFAAHERACLAGDVSGTHEPHREFHFRLFARAGDRMVDEVLKLRDHSERYRRSMFQGNQDEMVLLRLFVTDHRDIYLAAQARDTLRWSELMAHHLARTALILFAQSDEGYDPASVRVAQRLVRRGSAAPE